MTTELDHLRAFDAAAAAPDDDARAAARAALLDAIEAEPLSGAAQTRSGGRRRRPRRLLAGLGGLAVAGAAAVAIALTSGLGGGDVQPQPATAAQLLREAAAGAEHQPYVPLGPGQYWYVRTEGEAGFGDALLPRTVETWSGESESRDRTVVGPARSARFFSEEARRRWIEQGARGAGETQDVRYDAAQQPPRGDDPIADERLTPEALAALPTDPDALYDVLAASAAREAARLRLDAAGAGRLVYAAATRLLTQPAEPTPPALRAALYRVLARVPGVELLGETTDALGRPGMVVGFGEPGTGQRYDYVIDPPTGTVLEARHVLLEATPTSEAAPENVMPAGTTVPTTYVATGVVDSLDARP